MWLKRSILSRGSVSVVRARDLQLSSAGETQSTLALRRCYSPFTGGMVFLSDDEGPSIGCLPGAENGASRRPERAEKFETNRGGTSSPGRAGVRREAT